MTTEIIIDGTTPDFYWYEGEILSQDLKKLQLRLDRLVKVFKDRSKEQIELSQRYLDDCRCLRDELIKLKETKPKSRKPRKPRKGAK